MEGCGCICVFVRFRTLEFTWLVDHRDAFGPGCSASELEPVNAKPSNILPKLQSHGCDAVSKRNGRTTYALNSEAH